MSLTVNGQPVDAATAATPELAAVRELLRQRAAAVGLLSPETDPDAAIERLLETEVSTPAPTEPECRRYYDTHQAEFRSGELVFARHILFQVTEGVPVNHLRALAERTLKEVRENPGTFADRAGELSNCPSAQHGGNLGQLSRGETVPEFETALFTDGPAGILPGLVKSRFGFHIVAVDHRLPGEQVPFEAVQSQIATRLSATVQTRALAQYVAILAGQATITGVDLTAAASPLVQ